MEQIKEMWSLVFDWLGNGKKMIIGAIFLLIGIIGQALSEKTLAQIPFLLMAVGLMCFVNALFSKIADKNINLLLYQLIYVVVLEIGLAATSSGFLGNEGVVDGTTLIGIWLLCIVVAWILQSLLIKIDNVPKRLVLGLAETLLSGLVVVIAFVVPILIGF
ncbi:MAG: hypothetical protein J1F22_00335 [Lachnospiraceae bacterium]|nr:hypothetical protein [Lachnospiraceae bacterium]